MVQWIIGKKDLLTTIAGVLSLLGVVIVKVQEFIASGNLDISVLLIAVAGAVVAWFTGKKAQ
jgi:hypothetical protein